MVTIMVKRFVVLFIMTALLLALTGCCFQHEWSEATCTSFSTCTKCGKTTGELAEHTWREATCKVPRTCSVCGATEGEPKEHDWIDATCTEKKTCRTCGKTEGNALEHDYSSYKDFVCTRCGKERFFTNEDLNEMRRDAEVDYATFKKTYLKKEMLIDIGWVTHNYDTCFLTWDGDQYHFSSSNEEMKSFSGGTIRAKLTGVTKVLGKYTFKFGSAEIVDIEELAQNAQK